MSALGSGQGSKVTRRQKNVTSRQKPWLRGSG